MAARDEVLDRRVFSVGPRTYSWRDVVAAARVWSAWSEIERRARHALDLGVTAAEGVERAQDQFRYDRGLLAADDLEDWLDRWAISIDDWLNQVSASVARSVGVSSTSGAPASAEELDQAAWTEAVCSGELERLAERLAASCALSEAAGESPPGELGADELDRMEAIRERFREQAVTDERLQRRVRDEQLGWTRVEGRYLAHPDEDVVREAALGVREEGMDLEEMARAAGARYEPAARFYLAEVEGEVQPRLLSASPGELCGPLRSGDELWLLEVSARVAPTLEDPSIKARAAASVVEGAVRQEMLRRVRWHDRVVSA